MSGKTTLILEGGGMRGLYSAGILDTFMKNNINVDTAYDFSFHFLLLYTVTHVNAT